LQNSSLNETVANNVVAKKDPHIQSVYYKVTSQTGDDSYVRADGPDIPSQVDGANQYLLSSFLGGNAPDVVAFCTEHTTFAKKGAESWKGNHGGGSWEAQHMPLLIAGPGVKSGVLSHNPARLQDIAPTVLALLGVKSTGMEGIALADALQTPSSQQVQTQRTISRRLTPVVDALVAQSQKEIEDQEKEQ
jgi:arylsulfatase A-like enzyme